MLTSSQLDNQGLKDASVTKENPTWTIIFVMIEGKGLDFCFINNLGERHDFRREWAWRMKWQHVEKLMKPGTIHAFLMASWCHAGGKSGQNFKPLAHIAEFDSLIEARILNERYRELYEHNVQEADAKTGKRWTLRFCHQLRQWAEVKRLTNDFLIEKSHDIFDDEPTKKALKEALETDFESVDPEQWVNSYTKDHIFYNEFIAWQNELEELYKKTPQEKLEEMGFTLSFKDNEQATEVGAL